jgi:PTH1 family peptidyl-tRNA hydrolase
LIIGLGNPGTAYKNSRHNLGFKTVDLLCNQLGLHLSDQRFQTLSTSTNYHNKNILLACPQTLMNRSGIAVKYLVDHYKPDFRDIIVIHDDIDLDVGRIKIASGGGAGGHHGIESVAYHLGTNEFCRTKIGIGRPRYNEAIEDFVLNPFYDDQQTTIKEALHLAVKAIESFVLYGVEAAMNTFNSFTTRKKEGER